MNIAILDDSKEDLRQVKSVISSYYESQNTSADIHLYSSAEAFFTKYIPGFYDLIIMDIYMGSMTGMDAARKLREARDTTALIFISSSDSFAVESYDVQASYYLLKPFDPEKLCRILSTKHEGFGIGTASVAEVVQRMGGYVVFNTEEGIFKVNIFLPVKTVQ